jgi:general secretion pathway protein D
VWVIGLASAALAGSASAQSTRVYGLELQTTESVERVLVFADGPVSPKLEERGPVSSVLTLENAKLDPSAPRSLRVPSGGNVTQVTAVERSPTGPSQVTVTIRHRPEIAGRLLQEGSQLAIEYPRLAPVAEDEIVLDGKDVEIADVVRRISRHTRTPVIFDDTLQGQITIMAPQPFSSGEALALLDTLLLMRGFVALPSPGGPRAIVRIEGAPSPFVADLAEASGDQPVTTLVRLHAINAETVLAALAPMLGAATLGQVHAPTNALILGGSAARVTRIADVVRALDAAGTEQIFLRRLRFADVEETAAQLEAAYGEDGLFAVWPDTRTQTLGMRAKLELVPVLRDFLARVDRPAPARGLLHVLPVQHADPEVLAEIVRALQQGDAAGASRLADPISGGAPAGGRGELAGRQLSVVVDPPTHALVLQADPDTARLVHELVAELDRPPRQVEVEVSVMEVATGVGLQLGFDYFLPLTDPSEPDDLIAFFAGMPTGPSALFAGTPVDSTIDQNPLTSLPPVDSSLLARFTRSPVIIPVIGPGGVVIPVAVPRETAAVTADERDVFARMILRPRLLLVSGEEHEIFVGENVPILSAQADVTDPLQVRQNVERQDVGVVLRVKPTLGELGAIVLDLQLEVSALAPSQAGDSANVGPTIRDRVLTSTIRLEHDRVAMIGWHTGPGQEKIVTGVPFLKDIPWIGWLFRATDDRTVENHLLISVTAWSDDSEVRALAEVLRQALGPERGERVPQLGTRLD